MKNATNSKEEDYDPHLHRQLSKPTNNIETLIHLLKSSLGTGILAMPQAFARVGLVTGSVGIIVVGIILTYCLHILISSQYELAKRQREPQLTYTAAMESALTVGPPVVRPLAKPFTWIMDTFLIVYQLGICCVYVVFIATNVKTMVDPYLLWPLEVHMVIILAPLIALNCIRNLKLLAPFSAVANVFTLVGIAVVFYYILSTKKSDAPLDLWGSVTDLPLFLGTVLFALTAVGVVVTLEANMKTPKSFGKPLGVLNQGMTFIVLLYLAVGALGYVFCVNECSDSITLDLPHEPLAVSVQVLMTAAVFISYGLQCYVPVDILWRSYMQPWLERRETLPKTQLYWEYGLRISLCILTFLLAVSVPRLGWFISLFGAFCLSALGVAFPALMKLCVCYPQKTILARFGLIKDILLILFGIFICASGTYSSVTAIVKSFQ